MHFPNLGLILSCFCLFSHGRPGASLPDLWRIRRGEDGAQRRRGPGEGRGTAGGEARVRPGGKERRGAGRCRREGRAGGGGEGAAGRRASPAPGGPEQRANHRAVRTGAQTVVRPRRAVKVKGCVALYTGSVVCQQSAGCYCHGGSV